MADGKSLIYKSMSRVVVAVIQQEFDGEMKYLLVSSRRDFGEYTGSFYPPAGHVEQGESDMEALAREVHEELQLELDQIQPLAETSGDIEGQETIWFLVTVRSSQFTLDNEELVEAGWYTKHEVMLLALWPMTRYIFETYIF